MHSTRQPKSVDVSLINSGFAALNVEDSTEESRTIAVVGVPRSGTSMVAAALKLLDVYVGDTADSAVIEDVEIASALENSNTSELMRLIDRRNKLYKVWSFKRPMAFKAMSKFEHLFRNLCYIVIFRDPLAVAMRNSISMHNEVLPALRSAAKMNNELVDFVCNSRRPALLVSYEKAVRNPKAMIEKLCEFFDLPCSESQKEKALASLSDNIELYLQTSRIRPYEGYVDGLSMTTGISGWARAIVGTNNPVRVRLEFRGVCVDEVVAGEYRKDLELAMKNNGKCAFKFDIPTNSEFDPNFCVRIADDDFNLPRSGKLSLGTR